MDDAESNDFTRMKDFFYSLGISGASSSRSALILVSAPHFTASPMKLARKLSSQNFDLAEIGFDDLDVEAVEENLRENFADIFKKKEALARLVTRSSAIAATTSAITSSPLSISSGVSNIAAPQSRQEAPSAPRNLTTESVTIESGVANIAAPQSRQEAPSAPRNLTTKSATIGSGVANIAAPQSRQEAPSAPRNLTTKSVTIGSGVLNIAAPQSRQEAPSAPRNLTTESVTVSPGLLDKQEPHSARKSPSNSKIFDNVVAVRSIISVQPSATISSRSTKQTEGSYRESKKRGPTNRDPNLVSAPPKEIQPCTDVLQIISGQCIVTQSELLCCGMKYDDPEAPPDFPSVGCKKYPVSKGKWYFEVAVTSGGAQVGWADSHFIGGIGSTGVGDDERSWAHDGLSKMHGGICYGDILKNKWGDNGGYIGCSIDLDSPIQIMKFYLIQDWDKRRMQTASFTSFEFKNSLYPCASMDEEESIRFNFGDDAFARKIPKGFQAYADHLELSHANVCDTATRSMYRHCDGHIPNSVFTKAANCRRDDESSQLTAEIAARQWRELVAKMKISGLEIFTPKMCHGMDLAAKGNKKQIAYYFKESGRGWALGKMHRKTKGGDSNYFNWICRFDKVLREFYLADHLYIEDADLGEGKRAYEAANMSWLIFGKVPKKMRLEGKGIGRKRQVPACYDNSEIESSRFNSKRRKSDTLNSIDDEGLDGGQSVPIESATDE